MDNLIYILLICFVAPMFLLLLMLKKRAKLIVAFMLVGIFTSLFASELNTIMLHALDNDTLLLTTSITPATEEFFKALPILFYAIIVSDRRDRIFPISFALGIGFGMFENMVMLVQNVENATIAWSLVRGFSTALMHGICTLAVGYGICFVRKKKKLFVGGTFALLAFASTYHGIFNMLVQSEYNYIGYIMPAVTYIPILLLQRKEFRLIEL